MGTRISSSRERASVSSTLERRTEASCRLTTNTWRYRSWRATVWYIGTPTGDGDGLQHWQVSVPGIGLPCSPMLVNDVAGRSQSTFRKYKRSKASMWRQVFLRLLSCAALTTTAATGADLATATDLAATYSSVLIE